MKKRFLILAIGFVVLGGSLIWKLQPTRSQAGDPNQVTSAVSSEEAKLESLSQNSDIIATGRCTGTRSMWIQDGRVLVTLADIAVDDVVKGESTTTNLTVVLPGGVDANRRIPVAMNYPGAARIADGENVFLFLKDDAGQVPGGYAVTGFSEGKYTIVSGEQGEKLVASDNISTPVKTGPGAVRGHRNVVELNSFKQKVKDYVGR